MPSMSLEKLITGAREARMDAELARKTIDLVDLTSLRGDESDDDVDALCASASKHGVAAVCFYPQYLTRATSALGDSPIGRAAVVNFPDGSDDIERVCTETEKAVMAGADEIDLVAPLQSILDGDIELVGEMVEACRSSCGPDVRIKLILETGLLQRPDLITAAARSAVMAGVDMLKTSTGKIDVGATPEAVACLLSAAEESDGKVGVKISGGVRTGDDAAMYLSLIRQVMGDDWITSDHVRIGASSLLDDLLRIADG